MIPRDAGTTYRVCMAEWYFTYEEFDIAFDVIHAQYEDHKLGPDFIPMECEPVLSTTTLLAPNYSPTTQASMKFSPRVR